MTSLTLIVEALVCANANPEMILAAVKAFELEREKSINAKREKAAERQRRHRMSRSVTQCHSDKRDTPLNGSNVSDGFPCTPSLTSLTSLNPPKENPPKGGQKKNPPIKSPDWLPIVEWEAFRQMRIKIKKPMTEHAEHLAIKKLDQFRKRGHDPTEILNQSILNDYQDLYEPKENKNAANFIDKPTFKSEASRLSAKYEAEADREEQAAAHRNSGSSLRIAETIRENSGRT